MSQSAAFLEGFGHAQMGKSIHFNPYRNQGVEAAANNADWIDGWQAFKEESRNPVKPKWSMAVIRQTMF